MNPSADKTMRLYVSNLPWAVIDTDLVELFSNYGAVFWARVVKDEDGQSRGFGFVQMKSGQDAMRAIEALDGGKFKGRHLIVHRCQSKNIPVLAGK